MKAPTLKKGNCLVYAFLFRLNNPSAIICVKWNDRSRVPSFYSKIDGCSVFYKRIDRTQSRFWFNGKQVIIKK